MLVEGVCGSVSTQEWIKIADIVSGSIFLALSLQKNIQNKFSTMLPPISPQNPPPMLPPNPTPILLTKISASHAIRYNIINDNNEVIYEFF